MVYRLSDGLMVREVSLPTYVKWWYHGLYTEHGTIIVGHLGTAQTDEGQYAVQTNPSVWMIRSFCDFF